MPLGISVFSCLSYMILKTAICSYLCMSNSSSFLGREANGMHWLLLCTSLCVHRDISIWMLLLLESENKTIKHFFNEIGLAFNPYQLSEKKHSNKTIVTIRCFLNISIISPFKKRTKPYWKSEFKIEWSQIPNYSDVFFPLLLWFPGKTLFYAFVLPSMTTIVLA